VTNCTFSGNSAVSFGGGMLNVESSPIVTNCMFSGNTAYLNGGGMGNIYSSSPTIVTNCTFTDNLAGGAMYVEDANPNLTNCILWGNNPQQIYIYSGSLVLNYCDIQGGWPGVGNIDADPCFVDQGYWDDNGTLDYIFDDSWIQGNYHLRWDSPCIDSGDPNYVPEPNETDIDGEFRVMLGRVDIGADEFNPFEIEFIVVNKRRIGRTIFEYDCNVTLTNISRFAVSNVQLEIVKASENMVIIDPNVTFGDIEIGPGESATSIDMCSFQVDRSEAIEPAEIIWKSAYEMADGSPGVQNTALGISFLNLGVAGDITGNGKVDFEDLKVLADQWLQPPGSLSADIAPMPNGDNIVNFLDFAILAKNWLQGADE
jgi:hypothetical protein